MDFMLVLCEIAFYIRDMTIEADDKFVELVCLNHIAVTPFLSERPRLPVGPISVLRPLIRLLILGVLHTQLVFLP